MSILIKGLQMPKEGCKDCLLVKRGRVFDICPFLKREVNGNVERGGKPYDCPLVELPDHGDLIDRDKVREKAHKLPNGYNHGYFHKCVDELFDYAPVVISAERSE